MAASLKSFYNACNPLKPAGKEYYVDADKERGSRDFASQFLRELSNIEGDFLTFLFTGHLGCGKSSELRHLAEQLRTPNWNKSSQCYFPIILDAEEFVDSYDVTPTDVLLSILARVSQAMQEIKIELRDRFLWRRLTKIKDFAKDVFLSEIGAPGEISVEAGIPYNKVTAKFHLLKSDPANRKIVREAFERDTSSLKEEIKLQFEIARGKLHEARGTHGETYKDFVLILDNLEKIDRVQGQDEGYHSHQQFFIDGAFQLTGLGVHVVYTVPLTLVFHDGPDLATRYGKWPFVLPMIKIEERPPKRLPYPDGIARLKEMLQKRAGNTPLDELIGKDAQDFLIANSGGHTRQLITFVRSAIALTDTPPVTLACAEKAIADSVNLYSRMPAAYWLKLAKLELSPNQAIDSADDDFKAMLQQLIVLEYLNGDENQGAFDHAEPWYAVHPIVRQLQSFKLAVKMQRPKRGAK